MSSPGSGLFSPQLLLLLGSYSFCFYCHALVCEAPLVFCEAIFRGVGSFVVAGLLAILALLLFIAGGGARRRERRTAFAGGGGSAGGSGVSFGSMDGGSIDGSGESLEHVVRHVGAGGGGVG